MRTRPELVGAILYSIGLLLMVAAYLAGGHLLAHSLLVTGLSSGAAGILSVILPELRGQASEA